MYDPLSIKCPVCGSESDSPCREPTGKIREHTHLRRRQALTRPMRDPGWTQQEGYSHVWKIIGSQP